MLKMLIEKSSVNVNNHDKDKFYKQLLAGISSVENSEIHIIDEDFNSHFGKESVKFDIFDIWWQRLWHMES